MNKVNVLGTTYKIVRDVIPEENRLMETSNGVTDYTTKTITLAKIEKTYETLQDLDYFIKKVERHEIIHAFLSESGLIGNSTNEWAVNEEMVDWIAIQMPKMVNAMKSTGCLDE